MKILVVEKDDAIRETLGGILESDGFEVILEKNLISSHQILNTIDVCLVDRHSVNLKEWLKRSYKCKIVVMGTFGENIKGFKFLRKPFDLEKLLELIKN